VDLPVADLEPGGVIARAIAALRAHRRAAAAVALAVVAALGFAALRLVLRDVHLSDVRAALHRIVGWRLAAAVALTTVSYLALTGYDWLALRIVGRPRPWRTAATASFTSYTLSHNLGLSLLTGGSARYRVYTAAGLAMPDVVRVQAITAFGFWIGVMAFGAAGLLAAPASPLLSADQSIAAGVLLLALLAAVPVLYWRGHRTLGIGSFTLPIPRPADYGAMLGIAAVDLCAAAAALFVLVPGCSVALLPALMLAYAAAVLAGLVTHVPGGLGVFEAVMLALLPGDRPTLFAALIAYRVIYYLLPLCVAMALLAGIEGWRLRHPIGRGLSLVDRAARALAPTAIALLVLLGGLVLLLSGALPGVKGRLSLLDAVLPLPFIEASHLAGSLAGTALILIAPAVNARMRSGFVACRTLLVAGALFSLVKGIDYEEAAVLLGIAALLQFSAPAFTRRARLVEEPIDWTWLCAAAVAVALSVWAGLFSYQRVAYSDDLWWRFALDGNAPRFLRASFAAGVLVAGAAAWHFLSRVRAPAGIVDLPDDVAARAFARAGRTDAMLAYTGDKRFVIAAARDAFLMYGIRGRSWIVMGDPVGDPAAAGELLWSIRRSCAAARGRLCFYQASEAMLPLFVEMGLATMKYGEEATVDTAAFTLAGPAGKALRHSVRRAEAAGVTMTIVPAAEVPQLIPRLRAISDAWLAEKKMQEKGFSLGRFDPAYLARFDAALAWRDGQPIAFANIWTTPNRREASVDLMRHVAELPYGTMDYLFVRLIEWSRAQGYARFNLGMAPLSGMPTGPLAPLWARLGATAFSNGERLYGFGGLRHFKAKFSPAWAPRYIALSGGGARLRALLDLFTLVNGSAKQRALP
jgi:phosphatidylglycerol lysyltransferase